MTNTACVILAAGQGKRMKSEKTGLPKVLFEVAGVPILARVIQSGAAVTGRAPVVVLRHQRERIQQFLNRRGYDFCNAEYSINEVTQFYFNKFQSSGFKPKELSGFTELKYLSPLKPLTFPNKIKFLIMKAVFKTKSFPVEK